MIVTMMDRAKIRPASHVSSIRVTVACVQTDRLQSAGWNRTWATPFKSHTKQKYQERNFTCYWRQFAHKHTRLFSDNYARPILGLATGPSSPWFWVIALESLYTCEWQRETNDKSFMHSDTHVNGGDSQPFRAKKQNFFELDNKVYTHTRLIRVESEYYMARNVKAREKVR